ncbi:unnamed protein product [Mesocestoides corti]|uniref:Uncharacterized protein n=4 Tax=Mesocestoides corti TaxID=53468 RepID=A0A0R3U3W2_MESCO|nr:unnamed protein product [Mesocestoides corti]
MLVECIELLNTYIEKHLQKNSTDKVFEKSPYLMSSLLLSLARNYSAACAGDAITSILLKCQSNVNDWLEGILRPLANFLLHGLISCSTEKQLRGLTETDIHSVTKLRLHNFFLHCAKSPFANLRAGNFYLDAWDPPSTENTPFILELINHLVFLLEMKCQFSSHVSDHRLTNPKLVEAALEHNSDKIRAEACRALAQIVVKLPPAVNPQPFLHRSVLRGVSSLLSSTHPAARDMAIHAFFEMALFIRNRSVSSSIEDANSFDVPRGCQVSGYPDVSEVTFDNVPVESYLHAMGDIYRFAAGLWSCNYGNLDAFLEKQISGLTPFLRDLVFHPMLPPGMPYQRQKMLISLISCLFELSYIENDSRKIGKRFGFEPCTQRTLKQILTHFVSTSGFPSLYEKTTWLQLISSLPHTNPEIQCSIVNILTTYWSPTSAAWLNSEIHADLIQLAETWCDLHSPEGYTAGAALLQWLLTSVLSSSDVSQVTSRLLASMRDLCDAIPIICDSTDAQMHQRLIERILTKPGHGFLAAADRILSWYVVRSKFPQSIFIQAHELDDDVSRLGNLLSPELVKHCLHLSSACLALMGCPWSHQNKEGTSLSSVVCGLETSSFETLGRTILDLARQAQTTIKTPSESESAHEIWDSLTSTTALFPEYQHILSWAWHNLEITSSILSKWVHFRVLLALIRGEPLDDLARQYFTLVGKQLIRILMSCRHKGTVEAVHQSLQDYLTISEYLSQHFRTVTAKQDQLQSILDLLIRPNQVIDVCLSAVRDCKFSVTRRSAGLWPASKAALMAELVASPLEQPLLHRWLSSLLDISCSTGSTEAGDPEKYDPPRALALHLIKGIFEDARLGPVAFASVPPEDRGGDDWLTILACKLALPGFAASQWTIANGSLQLFASIVKRLVGPVHTRPGTTIAEVFGRYPALFDAFVTTLSSLHSAEGWQRCATAKVVVPLLGLLSRLQPSPNAAFSEERQAEMRCSLQPFLAHPVAKIRHLAAESFIPFCSSAHVTAQAALLASVGPLTGLLKTEHKLTACRCANACSGQLYAISAWLRQAPTSGEAVVRVRKLEWGVALRYLAKWTSRDRACWFLAAQLASVMRCIFELIPNSEKGKYRTVFYFFCERLQKQSYPNGLLFQPLFSEFHSAFYDLYHTIHDFQPLITKSVDIPFIFQSTPEEVVLTSHLLSNIHYGAPPDLAHVLSGTVLSTTLLSLALDRSVWKRPEDGIDLSCLERLTSWPLTDGQKSLLLPGILLAMAPLVGVLARIREASKFVTWWFENMQPCLSVASANQQSRITASQALLVWLNTGGKSCLNGLSEIQLANLLRLVLCGLFDECYDVRETTGRVVALLLDLQHPVCPSRGAHLLLFDLMPSLLSRPVEWLIDFYQLQLDSVIDRADTMIKLRAMNVLYEPDEANPYFDVQFVIILLLSALRHFGASDKVVKSKTASALGRLSECVKEKCDFRSATLASHLPALYQVALATQLTDRC